MLTYDDALNLEYYKKTSFTGWMGNMRFKIAREIPEEGEPFFHVWIWPGPYIFDLADKDKMQEATFPFTKEGKCQAVDWINEQNPEF